jgi:glycosyltransferase involved in cell wall biosynthesis
MVEGNASRRVSGSRLRIALVAPPLEPVPPPRYGGIERVVATLAEGLHRRGHAVTLFASGDSKVSCRLVPIVPRALWASGFRGDSGPYMQLAVAAVAAREHEFDVIHSHVESYGFMFASRASVPVVTTLHMRLDRPPTPELIRQFPAVPLVAISESQRRLVPDANWVATIHHGMEFGVEPAGTGEGGYLAFVGRIALEKGIDLAIELARRSHLRLRVAAKAFQPEEVALYERVVRPAEQEGVVEFLGELAPAARDDLLRGATASLMLGDWPEPFGLAAIESLGVGTPVIGRRAGALPEIVRHGRDGFIVDDIDGAERALAFVVNLDRGAIYRSARRRFSAARMIKDYEQLYRRLIDRPAARRSPRCTLVRARRVRS